MLSFVVTALSLFLKLFSDVPFSVYKNTDLSLAFLIQWLISLFVPICAICNLSWFIHLSLHCLSGHLSESVSGFFLLCWHLCLFLSLLCVSLQLSALSNRGPACVCMIVRQWVYKWVTKCEIQRENRARARARTQAQQAVGDFVPEATPRSGIFRMTQRVHWRHCLSTVNPPISQAAHFTFLHQWRSQSFIYATCHSPDVQRIPQHAS